MKHVLGCMAAALVLAACGGAATGGEGSVASSGAQALEVQPTGRGGGTRIAPPQRSASPVNTAGANGIDYHNGPVMLGSVNIYLIWYGNWSGNSATSILSDWANTIGGSAYYNINTTYYDGSNNHVSNALRLAGTTTDSYSRGTALADSDIQTIVSSAISSGRLPLDTNGVYFVLTSSDVNETSGFCTSYCGWHTYGTISGQNIKYSFVGNPDRCISSCAAQSTGPNGNAGADGMVSIISHELEETTSDPNLNAWYDSSGAENADKCAWTFGTEYTTANGAKANVHLGSRDFLIQQNWVNASGGYCALSYGSASTYFAEIYSSGDARRTSSTGDWDPGYYKAECGGSEAVTGVSRFTSSSYAHAALCHDDGSGRYPHNSCRTVTFASGDSRGTSATGDWDEGYYKGECAANEYVAGVSQSTSGKTESILCCAGSVAHTSCSAHVFASGDSRESNASGDWDVGYYKGECGTGRYVAGLSRTTSSGEPHALLCCSP